MPFIRDKNTVINGRHIMFVGRDPVDETLWFATLVGGATFGFKYSGDNLHLLFGFGALAYEVEDIRHMGIPTKDNEDGDGTAFLPFETI